MCSAVTGSSDLYLTAHFRCAVGLVCFFLQWCPFLLQYEQLAISRPRQFVCNM